MNICIRVDSSYIIGSGHLIRCLTLADFLVRKGCSVDFISRKLSGNINNNINKFKFKLHELKNIEDVDLDNNVDQYKNWLGVSQGHDANETITILNKKHYNLLIIDHYGIDETWEIKIKPYAQKIMVIDDLANRKHFCDIILDQNYHKYSNTRYNNLIPLGCSKLFGPKYVILRDEFLKIRKRKNSFQTKPEKRILIYFGASDIHNVTRVILKSLITIISFDLKIDIVISNKNKNKSNLNILSKELKNVKIHLQTNKISNLIQNADLSIGACGTSIWERMFLGIPNLIITVADNQREIAANLYENGYINFLGNFDMSNSNKIKTGIEKILRNPFLNKNKVTKGLNLVGGNGTKYISDLITGRIDDKEILIREVKKSDKFILWEWVNDYEVRKNSLNSKFIDLHEHEKWFRKIISDNNVKIYIAQTQYGLLGQVRFEIKKEKAFIDYSISRQFRGFGFGKTILEKSIKKFNKKIFFEAQVKNHNKASIHSFLKLGFKKFKINREISGFLLDMESI